MKKYKPIIEMQREDKIFLLVNFFIALLFLVGIIFLGVMVVLQIQDRNCYLEEHIFMSDVIKKDDRCDNEKCLFIRTIDVVNKTSHSYIFAKEDDLYSLRWNVKKGDVVQIEWCQANMNFGYIIRQVKKV